MHGHIYFEGKTRTYPHQTPQLVCAWEKHAASDDHVKGLLNVCWAFNFPGSESM